jgi:hypothetical protein
LKTLSIICEGKYDPIAMVVAQHYAIESKYQMHISILTAKQYIQESGKDGVFNEGWLLSIGKNACTSMYEHLIPKDISEEGFFMGVSGHVAIAYHDTDFKSEIANKLMKKMKDYIEEYKKCEGNRNDLYKLLKDGSNFIPFVKPSKVLMDIKDEITYIDLCMNQRAVDELLASDAKEWFIQN